MEKKKIKDRCLKCGEVISGQTEVQLYTALDLHLTGIYKGCKAMPKLKKLLGVK